MVVCPRKCLYPVIVYLLPCGNHLTFFSYITLIEVNARLEALSGSTYFFGKQRSGSDAKIDH